MFKQNVPEILRSKFNSKNTLPVCFWFISPSPGPVVRPVEVSDQRRSIHEPCLHTNQDPAAAASYIPDPLTSVQKEHQHHWEKEMRKVTSQNVFSWGSKKDTNALEIVSRPTVKAFFGIFF